MPMTFGALQFDDFYLDDSRSRNCLSGYFIINCAVNDCYTDEVLKIMKKTTSSSMELPIMVNRNGLRLLIVPDTPI